MTTFASTPNGVKTGIAMIFFLGPVILIAWALLLSFKFKLNKQTHEILKQGIKRLEDGGSKKDVTLKAKEVVEELTGYPYAKAWPDKPKI